MWVKQVQSGCQWTNCSDALQYVDAQHSDSASLLHSPATVPRTSSPTYSTTISLERRGSRAKAPSPWMALFPVTTRSPTDACIRAKRSAALHARPSHPGAHAGCRGARPGATRDVTAPSAQGGSGSSCSGSRPAPAPTHAASDHCLPLPLPLPLPRPFPPRPAAPRPPSTSCLTAPPPAAPSPPCLTAPSPASPAPALPCIVSALPHSSVPSHASSTGTSLPGGAS